MLFLIAVAALVVSLFTLQTTSRVATSDFIASQQVKSNSMLLTATLMSIGYKVAYSRVYPKYKDKALALIHHEKQIISEFLNSPSRIAYLMFVSKKSRAATNGEPWRVFGLLLQEITITDDLEEAGRNAINALNLLVGMTESDIEEVSSSVSDLPQAFASIKKALEEDTLLKAYSSWLREQGQTSRSTGP